MSFGAKLVEICEVNSKGGSNVCLQSGWCFQGLPGPSPVPAHAGLMENNSSTLVRVQRVSPAWHLVLAPCLARVQEGTNSDPGPHVYTMLGTLNASQELTHSYSSEGPWGSFLYYSQLTDENTEEQKQSVTCPQLVSTAVRMCSQLPTQRQCSTAPQVPECRAGSNHLDSVPEFKSLWGITLQSSQPDLSSLMQILLQNWVPFKAFNHF